MLRVSDHVELHKLRKTGATLHYDGGKGVPLGHDQPVARPQLIEADRGIPRHIKSTTSSQPHIQEMLANGRMAAFA